MKLTLTTTRGPIVVEVFEESVDVSGAYEALNGTYLGGTAEVIRVLVTAIEDLHHLVFFPCCVERLLGGPEGLLSRAAPREDPPPREDPERVLAKLVLSKSSS